MWKFYSRFASPEKAVYQLLVFEFGVPLLNDKLERLIENEKWIFKKIIYINQSL